MNDEWKLITEYNVENYKCGLKAGDLIRVKHDIVVRDHNDKPTGDIHKAGEIWTVLYGAEEDPGVVWLRQPDGERHTWDDTESIFDTFEKVTTEET